MNAVATVKNTILKQMREEFFQVFKRAVGTFWQ